MTDVETEYIDRPAPGIPSASEFGHLLRIADIHSEIRKLSVDAGELQKYCSSKFKQTDIVQLPVHNISLNAR